MNKAYRHTVLSLIIIAFMWVIIGDLVNMHMKIIYKKDLYSHKTSFIKTLKKDKKDYHLSLKKTELKYISGTESNLIRIYLPEYSIIFNEKLSLNKKNYLFALAKLRAPPYIV